MSRSRLRRFRRTVRREWQWALRDFRDFRSELRFINRRRKVGREVWLAFEDCVLTLREKRG